jgi:hypothetical protein
MLDTIINFSIGFPLTRGVAIMLSILVKPIKRRIIKRFENQVRIYKNEARFMTNYDYPPLSFRILLDSKVSLPLLKIERVVLRVSLSDGTPLDTFIWLRAEYKDKDLETYLGYAEDITEKRKQGNIGFLFVPPLYLYEIGSDFYLNGYIKVGTPFGAFIKEINGLKFKVDKQKWIEVSNAMKERRKVKDEKRRKENE